MEPIGREDELADIVARVRAGRRLVTIVGPGGIGKTTLARAASAALDGGTPEGRLVELSRVDRSDAVTGAIAADLGFTAFDVVLGSSELTGGVVVVDNCEHVADAAAGAVDAMLRACPRLVILATSRSPLALDDESIVALAPLGLPSPGVVDATCGSVRLFRERARDAGVTIDEDDLEVVGEICRRVDGMPLPLELAAARLRSMSLGEIVTRLGEGIDVLQRPRYRGAVRHRSVRDTINWSVDLLDDADRLAFARLSVCPGLFDVALVDALADLTDGEGIELIGRLVDASLVVVDHRSTPTRYRLLEPICAVALDLLDRQGERHAAQERLTTYVLDRAAVAAAVRAPAADGLMAVVHQSGWLRAGRVGTCEWATSMSSR